MSYSDIAVKKNELIRKGLEGSVFLAPFSAAVVDETSLFDSTTGQLKPLPAGYVDLGWLTDAGVKASRAIKQSDLMAWGSNDPVRSDTTSDITTLVIEAQETNLQTMALYAGVDPTTITPGTNGVIAITQPLVNPSLHYRILVVSVDQTDEGEFVLARVLPRAAVSDITDQVFANGDSATTWGVTLTAYPDSVAGYSQKYLLGGAGCLALLDDMGFSRTLTVSTTSASPNITATVGTFNEFDKRLGISDGGVKIAANSKILSVTDSTHAVLDTPAAATGTGIVATIA